MYSLAMTPTEDLTIECPQCRGAGRVPRPGLDEERRRLLLELREVGERRKAANRHTTTGRLALDAVFGDIRLLAPQAVAVGLTRVQQAEALGFSRVQLANVLKGNPAGK